MQKQSRKCIVYALTCYLVILNGKDMKRLLLGISLSVAAMACSAGNPVFIDFVVKQAHQKDFYGCDAAIKSAFDEATGDDIRVNTDWFDATKDDFLKLTATFGSADDSVYIEAEFRKHSGKCYVTKTSVITSPRSCTAYASEMKAFEFQAETPDYIWMKSKGGVSMYLKPLNGGCIATFQLGTFY